MSVGQFEKKPFPKLDGNETPTYQQLIEKYRELADEHKEIELYNMGESDYGLPIYVCVLNGTFILCISHRLSKNRSPDTDAIGPTVRFECHTRATSVAKTSLNLKSPEKLGSSRCERY